MIVSANFPQGLAGLIFDCDGVMIDSEEANRYFYNLALAAFGLPPMTKEQEKYAFMSTARDALLRMVPKSMHGDLDDRIRNSMNYARDVLPHVKLMPGFDDFIELAHKKGLLLAIDTNRTDEGIERILEYFKLPNYFNPVICATHYPAKPDPAGALAICRQWQIEPGQALFVGDSEIDRQTAANAGIKFAAFRANDLDAQINVANFAELANLLGLE